MLLSSLRQKKPKHLLLVLDNCEHLIEACAAFANALLRACPNLRILATSREVLGIAGETAWRVPPLSLPDPKRLEHEGADLVSALTPYESVQLFIERAQAALALWRFWFMCCYFTEGRGWLEEALRRNSGASAALRAKAFTGVGYMAWSHGDYERALGFYEEALALYREVGDKWGVAFALHNLGAAVLYHGDHERAGILFEESLALAQEVGDKWLIAVTLIGMGEPPRYRGDYERSSALNEESLSFAREAGDMHLIALTLDNLGLIATAQDDYARAAMLHKESLVLYRKAGEKRLTAACMEGLAKVVCMQGQPERAAYLFGAAEALREAINHPLPPPDRADYDRSVGAVHAALSKEAFATAWAEGRKMTLEQALASALEA